MNSFFAHYGQQILIATIVFGIIAIAMMAYFTFSRTGQRKQIAARGIQALGGICPKCSGKLKAVDLFSGRGDISRYKIGAARCTRCNHLEIFSEEP